MPDPTKVDTIPPEGEEKSSPFLVPENEIPSQIGPYKIESLLERGGMSLLFVGRKEDDPTPIIIKILSKRFLTSPEAVKRFLAEADIIALANHPNIVRLMESGKWEDGVYIAMEYIRGKTLRETILKTPLSLRHALEISLEIAYALCHLHSHHVIHRDLKPENILVTNEGKIKVIDFGIAQLLYIKELKSNGPKHFIGTPIYMSPEQRESPENVSYPSDIYSLGIIVYELVMGRISKGQIHLSLCPKGLQQILLKALQPKPEDRYDDTVDFVSDLLNYLHSEQIEKDLRPQDKLIEEVDSLKKLSKEWFQPPFPNWKKINIKAMWDADLSFPRLAWDFLDNDTHQAFIFFECLNASITNAIPLSWIKGILESKKELLEYPEGLAMFLNKSLLKSPGSLPYIFACLSFNKKNLSVNFTSAGGLEMTLLSQTSKTTFGKKQLPLGIEESYPFKSHTLIFKEHDKIFIHPFENEIEKISREIPIEEIFLEIKRKNPSLYLTRPPYLFSFET